LRILAVVPVLLLRFGVDLRLGRLAIGIGVRITTIGVRIGIVGVGKGGAEGGSA
jgi:hypothetical protein